MVGYYKVHFDLWLRIFIFSLKKELIRFGPHARLRRAALPFSQNKKYSSVLKY